MLLQPGDERRGIPVGQEIDDPLLLEIHQDRAIVAAAAKSEIVDAQDAQVRRNLAGRGDRGASHEPQQGVATRPGTTQAETTRESLPTLPPECEAHGF